MDFNPRSRTGSDSLFNLLLIDLSDFNPRSRTGSDLFGRNLLHLCKLFQSTLPHGERPETTTAGVETGYFNPRSRTGSDAVF